MSQALGHGLGLVHVGPLEGGRLALVVRVSSTIAMPIPCHSVAQWAARAQPTPCCPSRSAARVLNSRRSHAAYANGI